MADHATHRNIEVTIGDRVVSLGAGRHLVRTRSDPGRQLHAESGHLPVGSRAKLVDAVLDLPELHGNVAHLEATIPLGDTESLQRLRERTDHMTTRAAGSTALIDADLRPIDKPGLDNV